MVRFEKSNQNCFEPEVHKHFKLLQIALLID
jgi:hypothetical protein